MNFFATSDAGGRDWNEDAVAGFTHHGYTYLLIADGQGSKSGGLSAGQIAVDECVQYIQLFGSSSDPPITIMQQALHVSWRAIEGVRRGDPSHYNGFATALTMVCIAPNREMHIVHVGNTRLYIVRDGQWIQATTDHTVTQQLLQQRKITPAQARQHPERHFLTRGIGVFPSIQATTQTGTLVNNDILVLMTDGVYEYFSSNELSNILSQASGTKDLCEKIIQEAKQKQTKDNISLVCSYINY